jgi:ATP-binding cassette subfamily C protein CydD
MGVLAAAAWLVLARLLSEVVDRIFLHHRTLGEVGGWLAAMAVLLVARSTFVWAGEIVAQRGANRLKSALRGRLTEKLLALGPTYTRGERTGELVHLAVEGIEALDEYMSQYQPARLLAGFVPLLVLAVVGVLDPWTLPILLFAGPILIVLLALIGGRTAALSARRFREMSWMSAHFLDMLRGLETLKLFGRSKEQVVTIERISRRFGTTTMDVLRTAFQTSLVLEWAATAATALVAIEVSLRLMAGALPFVRAFTLLLVTPEFFVPLRQLALKYHAGSAGKAAAQRLYTILDTPLSGRSSPLLEEPEAPIYRVPKYLDIQFEDVYVSYEDGRRPALNGLDLRIAQGQTVALVGATGAGKSTAVNLLLRFAEPARGTVTAGGVRLAEIDPALWRTLVAWVPQHPYLFHGTIAENLCLGMPEASAESVAAAARASHADEFIERLPYGYDTQIGEQGLRLSGGQRQRLAIARAFLKDAPLLVLDEATSHLDEESEQLIQDALIRLMRARTVLVISHRLKLVDHADMIAVLDGGRVVQEGPPGLLANEAGIYGQLKVAYGPSAG